MENTTQAEIAVIEKSDADSVLPTQVLPILKNWIEPLSKLAVVSAVIFYGAGFIVVNSYLTGFGYFLFDFFRVGYVSAGILAVGFLILPFLIFWKILDIPAFLVRHKGQSKAQKFFAEIAPIIWMGTMLAVWIVNSNISFINLLSVLIFSMILGLWGFENLSPSTLLRVKGKNLLSVYVLFLFFILLFYLFNFGRVVYGHIPVNFGGGEPTNVLLVCDEDSRGYFELTGINFYSADKFKYLDSAYSNKSISQPVGLLAESDQSYTVIVKQKDSLKAVSFDRKLAKAVIHANSVVVGSLK